MFIYISISTYTYTYLNNIKYINETRTNFSFCPNFMRFVDVKTVLLALSPRIHGAPRCAQKGSRLFNVSVQRQGVSLVFVPAIHATEWGASPCQLSSGEHTKSYWKLPFIVDFPIQNGDFP